MSVACPPPVPADRQHPHDRVGGAQVAGEEGGDRRMLLEVADGPELRQPERAVGRGLDQDRSTIRVRGEEVNGSLGRDACHVDPLWSRRAAGTGCRRRIS